MTKKEEDAEYIIFHSKEQRDWSKFTAPWYKKEKFDPKTLQPFDKVIVRDEFGNKWFCSFFSNINNNYYECIGGLIWKNCIPYNEDTKHLVKTTEEAPEYYKYWED